MRICLALVLIPSLAPFAQERDDTTKVRPQTARQTLENFLEFVDDQTGTGQYQDVGRFVCGNRYEGAGVATSHDLEDGLLHFYCGGILEEDHLGFFAGGDGFLIGGNAVDAFFLDNPQAVHSQNYLKDASSSTTAIRP